MAVELIYTYRVKVNYTTKYNYIPVKTTVYIAYAQGLVTDSGRIV